VLAALPASSLPAQYSQPANRPTSEHPPQPIPIPTLVPPLSTFPLSTPLQARTYPCVAHNQNRVDARKGERKSILPWQSPVQPSIIGCHSQSVSYAFSGNTPILPSVWLYLHSITQSLTRSLITHSTPSFPLSLSPERQVIHSTTPLPIPVSSPW
jgi:hypothetical protein